MITIDNTQKKCRHKWRVNDGAFEEGCIGAICIKCGERGCGCDVLERNGQLPKSFWDRAGVKEIKDKLNNQL